MNGSFLLLSTTDQRRWRSTDREPIVIFGPEHVINQARFRSIRFQGCQKAGQMGQSGLSCRLFCMRLMIAKTGLPAMPGLCGDTMQEKQAAGDGFGEAKNGHPTPLSHV